MRLLERDHPLAVLRGHARRAAAGRGSVVLVAGEAGIGKTVLLRALADGPETPVLWGMCDPLSTPRPLGYPVVEPVRQVQLGREWFEQRGPRGRVVAVPERELVGGDGRRAGVDHPPRRGG